MSNRFKITSSVGAWEFGEWRILGETASLSEEVMPALTEEGLEGIPKGTKLEDYEPGASREEVKAAMTKAATPVNKLGK